MILNTWALGPTLRGTPYGVTMSRSVVNLDRKMAVRAARVIVVADSSKFGKSGMCKVFGPEDYDAVVTDSGLGKDVLKRLAKKRVQVEVAD